MKYEVCCECGKTHGVSAADAGATLTCVCGRRVNVPSLHELRTSAGQSVLSPALRIQSMLLENQLPGSRNCASCSRETDGLAMIRIECELGQVKGSATNAERGFAGCISALLGGWLLGAFVAGVVLGGERGRLKQVGQDVECIVPLPVCDSCLSPVSNPELLRIALRQIPEYAMLLDQYPNARIVLIE